MEKIRLFYALWPDKDTRNIISSVAKSLEPSPKGRNVDHNNLHMTLHFIGNTTTNLIPCYIEQAQTVAFKPFTLTLDRVGFFQKQKIVWIGCNHVPEELITLQSRLGTALRKCGFKPETRQYKPHVSLYRQSLIQEKLLDQEIVWKVNSFSLIKSEQRKEDIRYHPIEHFRTNS